MHNKNILLSKLLVLGISIGLIVQGCGSGSENSESESLQQVVNEAQQESTAESQEEEEERSVLFIPPNPVMIANMLRQSGLAFDKSLLSPVENIQKMKHAPEKSLALGIYSADLAYAVLNDEMKTAKDYLKALKIVSEGAGLSQAFDSESVADRFEANMNNQDSISNLLFEINEKTNNYLADTDQENKMVIYFIGAWAESINLILVTNDELGKRIKRRVGDQLGLLPSITSAMEEHAKNNALYDTINTKLKEVYESLPKEYDEDYEEWNILMDELDTKALATQIAEIRTIILNP